MTLRGDRSGGLLNFGGATIENRAGATFEFRDDQGIAYANDPLTLANDGHLAKAGVGIPTLRVCYQGSGTIDDGIVVEPTCP